MTDTDSLREALAQFQAAAYPVAPEINPRGYNWSEAYLDQALENARQALATLSKPEGCTVAREVQAVWRCAVGDFVGAVDVLKNRWINSRRKHEREAGEELNRLASLIWAARSPAPETYDDARKAGTALIERVRAALQPEKTKP